METGLTLVGVFFVTAALGGWFGPRRSLPSHTALLIPLLVLGVLVAVSILPVLAVYLYAACGIGAVAGRAVRRRRAERA